MPDKPTRPTVRQNLDLAEGALTRVPFSYDDEDIDTAVEHVRSARTILTHGQGSQWLALVNGQLYLLSDAELRRPMPGSSVVERVYGRVVPDPDGVPAHLREVIA